MVSSRSEQTDWCEPAFRPPGAVGKAGGSDLFPKRLGVLSHLEQLEGSAEAQCTRNVQFVTLISERSELREVFTESKRCCGVMAFRLRGHYTAWGPGVRAHFVFSCIGLLFM